MGNEKGGVTGEPGFPVKKKKCDSKNVCSKKKIEKVKSNKSKCKMLIQSQFN